MSYLKVLIAAGCLTSLFAGLHVSEAHAQGRTVYIGGSDPTPAELERRRVIAEREKRLNAERATNRQRLAAKAQTWADVAAGSKQSPPSIARYQPGPLVLHQRAESKAMTAALAGVRGFDDRMRIMKQVRDQFRASSPTSCRVASCPSRAVAQ